ncbi:MAG: hypothetical protein O7A03_04775, partial [Alphaproteobacteria bacterium]|nr:hypothetical protein [Alphaproteobacteria bacterium]
MSDVSEGKDWCVEIRKGLRIGPPATTGKGEAKSEESAAKSAAVTKSAARVAKALNEFQKEFKAKKKEAPTADLGSIETGMAAIAAGLKAAVAKKDAAGVAAQEEKLAALKAELDRKILAEALESLAAAKSTLSKLKAEITSTFGGLPAAIGVDFSKLDTALDLESETDPAKIETAAEAAGDTMAAIEEKARVLGGERTAYLADLALIEARVTGLEGHTAAAEVPVKALIDPIVVDLTAAKALATAHDYAGAQKKLVEIAGNCTTAMAFANDHAHYQALLADRQTRVDALTDPVPQAEVQKMVTDVKAKLTLAKTNAADGKFGPAVKLLGEVPQDCIDTAWAIKKAAEYAALRTKIDGYITEREKSPEVAEVGLYIAEMKTRYAQSDYATTKDYVKSINILQRVDSLDTALYNAIKIYNEFKEKHELAELWIKELKAHKGHEAIAGPIARMESDLVFAEAKKTAKEFIVAKNVCANIVKIGEEARPTAVA